MDLPQGVPWPVAALLALFGGGGVWGWLAERSKSARFDRTEAGAVTKANADFQLAVSEAARDLLSDYREQLRFVRGRCDELEQKFEASEQHRHECEASLAELRARVDQLLSEQRALPYMLPPPGAGR